MTRTDSNFARLPPGLKKLFPVDCVVDVSVLGGGGRSQAAAEDVDFLRGKTFPPFGTCTRIWPNSTLMKVPWDRQRACRASYRVALGSTLLWQRASGSGLDAEPPGNAITCRETAMKFLAGQKNREEVLTNSDSWRGSSDESMIARRKSCLAGHSC